MMGFQWEHALLYGLSLSLFFHLYLIYCRTLPNIVILNVNHLFKITIHWFFVSVIFFSIYGYFLGALDGFVILILSITIPIYLISSIYRESIGHFRKEKFFKLKLILLWLFYGIVFHFGFIYHEQLFRYIIGIPI